MSTTAFRAVLGPGARKQLARETCVSQETVKRWFAGEWPAARKRQLRELLLQHCDRQQRTLDDIRRQAGG